MASLLRRPAPLMSSTLSPGHRNAPTQRLRWPTSSGAIRLLEKGCRSSSTAGSSRPCGALPVSLSTDETALVVRMLDLSWAREMTGMARGAGPVDVLIRFMASLGQDVSPSRMFDETYYRALVRTSGLPRLLESEPAFLHWMRHGRAQRLVPSSNFDEAYYSRNNRDIVVWGYEHFVQHGIHEGRMPRDLLPISLPKPLSHDDETSLMFGRLSEKDVTLHGPGDAAAYNVPLGTLAQQSRTLLQSPAFKAMVAEASGSSRKSETPPRPSANCCTLRTATTFGFAGALSAPACRRQPTISWCASPGSGWVAPTLWAPWSRAR